MKAYLNMHLLVPRSKSSAKVKVKYKDYISQKRPFRKHILFQGIDYPFTLQILILTHQQQTAFEKIVGKEEIARHKQFLLFPQCFLLNQIIVSPFVHIFVIISLFAAELEEPEIAL